MRYPLTRELGRQAMLIAARDGLGMATRDETLGESLPGFEEPAAAPLGVRMRAFNEGHGRLILEDVPSPADSSSSATEWGRFEFEFQSDSYNMYTALATVLAAASRAELVDILRDAGYSGEPISPSAAEPLPEGVESLLSEMNFVSQFAAIQRIHDAMTEDGESPARLGGLVRGYAHLAMLTRHHWSSANAAFAARSLLYAERLMAQSEDPRLAQLHRAYARALVGLHGMATQDLDQLPADENARKNATTDPAWAIAIEPFCRFDEQGLMVLADEPGLRQLAHQLQFELKSCYCIERWNMTAGPSGLKQCPESFGIYSTLANDAPMLTQRQAVRNVAEAFGRQIPRRVVAIQGIPKSVVEVVGTKAGPDKSWLSQWLRGDWESSAGSPLPVQIAAALDTADPQPEPSWQMLATLIRNEQFVEVADSLMVASNAVEYSKQEMVDRVAPLVENHPYAPYVLSYATNRNREPAKIAEFAAQVTARDPRPNMQRMFNQFWAHADAKGQRYCDLSTEALWQHDYRLPAMIASLQRVDDSWWQAPNLLSHFQRYVLDMKSISPHAPNTLRLEIDTAVDPTKEQLIEWEERGQNDPQALTKLAKLHDKRQDFEAAIRCYDRSYELSPSHSSAIGLATAYRAAEQDELWLPALEDYLNQEDYALGHALIHQHIARDYMAKGKWADAEPHALGAAQTWSAWGLILAGQVYEGLGRWDESEKWFREAVENYPTYSGYQWYFWCRRTGRGDVESARRAFAEFLELDWVKRRQNENYPWMNAMLSSQYQQALDEILSRPEYAEDVYWQTHAVMLAKRAGNDVRYAELSESLAKLVEEQYHESDPNLCSLYRLIQKLQQRGRFAPEDIANIDNLFEEFGPISRTNYGYFLGEQLALHDDLENADKYWRLSFRAGQFQKYNATLSGHRLAELHGTSQPDKIELEQAEPVKESQENVAENSL